MISAKTNPSDSAINGLDRRRNPEDIWSNRYVCITTWGSGPGDARIGGGRFAFTAMSDALGGTEEVDRLWSHPAYSQTGFCDEGVSVLRIDARDVGFLIRTQPADAYPQP